MRILAALLCLLFALPALAEAPLLMEGKRSLYQRVLVRDATTRHSAPDQPGTTPVRPLEAFYVYARQGDWLQVGGDETGAGLFWIPAAAATDWKQNIVATFEGSENLGRLLFLRDMDAAYGLVEAEDPAPEAVRLRAEAEAAEAGGAASETVVALGPRRTVDLRQNLYVLPILNAEEAVMEANGAYVNLLDVAVARAAPQGRPIPIGDESDARQEFRAGVVFVVDTTISMQPYIDATREALSEIYDYVAQSDAAGTISFGLVGFRDNVSKVPGIEYDVKTFVTLQDGVSAARFHEGISQMTEAQVSTQAFREDSYAGIEHALSVMDWSGFGARYIVLVTDASPREAGDALSSTGLSGAGLNAIVKERLGAAVAVMHLKGPRGAKDHPLAEAAYRQLAAQPNGAPLYFPIERGDAALYRARARDVGRMLVDQVTAFRKGADIAPPTDAGQADLASAGRTMQLAWLGAQTSEKAPDVFEAVVVDRDFERPGLKPLSIRVLISKAELSDLQEALQIIVGKAEENVIDPDKFFAQVLGAAADMSRDPGKVSRRTDASLAEAAQIDEFIRDLPYKSRIMAVTQDDWLRLPISEQQTIVNELYEKIERYRRYNETTDLWVDYLGGGEGGTKLYPMRLDDLP